MLKLSFIIPTYNTGKLLGKCLESIVEQSESEVETEIIVVDDGSTDNTNEIISKYKESVRYIKKENSGVSDARNVGIKEAHGDYLCFVDSDDYISPYLCASVTESLQTKADIIYFGYCEGCQSNYQFENVPTTKMSDSLIAYGGGTVQHLLNSCLFKKEQDEILPIRPATVWGKLYRKGFIVDNHISFASGMVLNEDVLFNACLLLKTPKIEYLPLSLYYYRINNSNSGSTPEKDIERKLLVAAEAMSAFADECDSSEIHERVSLRIDSYVQRYFRKYIMSNYVEGYFNKRREFFRFTNISIFKKARKTVNMKNIDFTGKLFYICTEKGCFFPLYMREKLRNAKARIKHPLVK